MLINTTYDWLSHIHTHTEYRIRASQTRTQVARSRFIHSKLHAHTSYLYVMHVACHRPARMWLLTQTVRARQLVSKTDSEFLQQRDKGCGSWTTHRSAGRHYRVIVLHSYISHTRITRQLRTAWGMKSTCSMPVTMVHLLSLSHHLLLHHCQLSLHYTQHTHFNNITSFFNCQLVQTTTILSVTRNTQYNTYLVAADLAPSSWDWPDCSFSNFNTSVYEINLITQTNYGTHVKNT